MFRTFDGFDDFAKSGVASQALCHDLKRTGLIDGCGKHLCARYLFRRRGFTRDG